MAVILSLSAELAGHLASAMSLHRKHLQRLGMREPKEFGHLFDSMTERATEGQRGTPLADLWEFIDSRTTDPLLVTYEAAAHALSVSVRTLKRLLADETVPLNAVTVNGVARIRTQDLEDYVKALTKETK